MKRNILFMLLLSGVLFVGCKRDAGDAGADTTTGSGTDSTGVSVSSSTNSTDPEGPQYEPADPKKFDESSPRLIGRAMAEAPVADNPQLAAFLRVFAKDAKGDDSKYAYNIIDLNSDKGMEFVVALTGPKFCKDGMCRSLVLSPQADGTFTILADFGQVVFPVNVSEDRTNGWFNLITQVAEKPYTVHTYQDGKYVTSPDTWSGEKNVTVCLVTAMTSKLTFAK
ncbi:MAG: hypothetical protein HUU34_17930 [Saprospiraceae bacterium]|jgi:hypothetical protein|nr:hypothetical protein [Saprospiraceae bacterium]